MNARPCDVRAAWSTASSRERIGAKGDGMVLADVSEVHRAHSSGELELQARIKVRIDDWIDEEDGNGRPVRHIFETTACRALMS